MTVSAHARLESPLDVGALLRALQADGLIAEQDARRVPLNPGVSQGRAVHPITHLINAQLPDARRSGQRLGNESLMRWLAGKLDCAYRAIDPLAVDVTAVTSVMSFEFAQRHRILALELKPEKVVIASCDPGQSGWQANLKQVLKRDIEVVLADPEDIDRYTVEFYSLSRSVRRASDDDRKRSQAVTNLEQLLEITNKKEVDANDGHVVNIVDWLLQYAYDQRASDIHIEPRREVGKVRFRIDGVLYTVYELPQSVMAAVVARLKVLGRMDLAEKRRPQDGRLKTRSPDGGEIELRLSTLPTAFGEKMVMRIFDPEVLLRSFDDLGLRGEDYQRWHKMIGAPHGIVLVTGPTGSGKTTTLYSSLKQLATSEVNVCTIEDPIEMVEEHFNQMQAQPSIGLDFASGVRALLRQDPDIIMIGEIRDIETAEMAIQAALTGHLVLSTLHTNDAPTAITRLLELGVPAYLIKATVLGVMAQRLVRNLCPHCKQPVELDQDGWDQLVAPWRATPPEKMYAPVGCLECRNTGYYGRQGLYEIMPLSETLKAEIDSDINLKSLRHRAVKEGMHTLRMSGAQKVGRGDTTIDEVLRVAPPPQNDG